MGVASSEPSHLLWQVLPFLYTHMVSLSCTIYLTGSAFLRGRRHRIVTGLVRPLMRWRHVESV
jgi:hypothetical protein